MFKDRDYFPAGISTYCPAMQYADMFEHGVAMFSLGSPAASDDDLIDASVDADATAGTIEVQDWTADAKYGRALIVTPSADPGAAGGVLDVHGFDYLGQPMVERFTGANGATSILYGKKAFKRVTKTVIITATTNATTYKVGTGYRVGLPYKGDIAWVKENGVYVPLFKRDTVLSVDLAAAAVAGGPSGMWIVAPCPGYVKSVTAKAGLPAGSTNDAAVTVELGGTAITGLSATADTSGAAVSSTAVVSDTPTTAGYSANNRFRTGDAIELVVADADASGNLTVDLTITPTQLVVADETDPATRTTGDPRGCYESIATLASYEIFVGMFGDPTVNTSGNGGLHGIQQYYA